MKSLTLPYIFTPSKSSNMFSSQTHINASCYYEKQLMRPQHKQTTYFLHWSLHTYLGMEKHPIFIYTFYLV